VPAGSATVTVIPPAGYVATDPPDGVATVTIVGGQTITQDFSLSGFGDVSGTVLADGIPLPNVAVDLVANSNQFIQFATTDGEGHYAFTGVPTGVANVSIIVPLGYQASDPEAGAATVTIDAGETAVRDFTLELLADAGASRTIGYWKHQLNVHISGRGTAQETFADMNTTFPLRIFEHFYNNQLNSIDVLEVTFLSGPVPMTLSALHATLNIQQASMLDRAKQQYLALLLNVASNRLRSTDVVSADGGAASQAIQQIAAQIKDGNPSNDEAAKDLADTINNGLEVAAGVIDLSQPVIPFAPGPSMVAMERAHPNPMLSALTVEFEVREAGAVKVAIYDASGRHVRDLSAGTLPRGHQRVMWDGRAADGRLAPNGVYFYRITMPDRLVTSKFVVMRTR
jgi:hypothetical protein